MLGTKMGPPSDLKQVRTVARYELRKHMRSKGVVGMAAIVVAVIALMTLIPPMLGEDHSDDPVEFVQGYLAWIELIILVGAVAFASGSIVSEFDKRTGLLMFSQPVKRSTFLAGKFLATGIVLAVMVGLYYLVVSALSLAITGSVPSLMSISFGFALLYGLAMSSVAYLFSSMLKTGTAATILTVITFLMILPMVTGLLSVAGVDPWPLVSHAADAVTCSLEDPYPVTSVGEMGRMTMTNYVPTQGLAALVMLAYAVIPVPLTWSFMRRREL